MGAYNPPAPAVVPIANGLMGVVVNNNVYLGVKMSDDSVRICSFDNRYPVGVQGNPDLVYPIVASQDIHEQQPAVVPMRFVDYIDVLPAGYETIELEARFLEYNWDEQEQTATWSANLYCGNVNVYPNTVVSGDQDITIIVE